MIKLLHGMLTLTVALLLVAGRLVFPADIAPARADTAWTKDVRNPVFDEAVYAGSASVIYDSDEHIYKMWYTHAITDVAKIDGLVDDILGLSLGNLIDDIKSLNWSAIAQYDAANVKNVITYLAGLSESDLNSLVTGTGTTIRYATSVDGVTWQDSGVVLEGSSGQWDQFLLGTPSVIKSGGSYEMWYGGSRMNATKLKALLTDLSLFTESDLSTLLTDLANADIVNLISDLRTLRGDLYILETILDIIDFLDSVGLAIGHATSADGVNWDKDVGNPVLEGGTGSAWDRYGAASPSVVKTGSGGYEMWYTGFKLEYDVLIALLDADTTGDIENTLVAGISVAIGRATSSDGVSWVKDSDNPVLTKGSAGTWDSWGVATPSVIRYSGGSYELWYTGARFQLSSFIDFLKNTETLNNAILAGVSPAIGHATSTDGISWVKGTGNPILSRGTGDAWDKYGVWSPSVIESGVLQMWYTGAKLDAKSLFTHLLDGDTLPTAFVGTKASIGRAYVAPEEGAVLSGGATTPAPSGTTSLSGYITSGGEFTSSLTATSDDSAGEIVIPAGTIGLNSNGAPLDKITMTKVTQEVPSVTVPENANMLGFLYDFGPNGATFEPPVTLTMSYDATKVPAGISEDKLYAAYYDVSAAKWVALASAVDVSTHKITALISHFTNFAVLASTRPASFTVSSLSVTPKAGIGETVTASVLVANEGDLADTYGLSFKVNGSVVSTRDVTLAGGASETVVFTTTRDAAGTYTVDVNGLTGTFTIIAPPPPPTPVPAPVFAVSALSVAPDRAVIGESITISVTVSNTGNAAGDYNVVLKLNGQAVDTKKVNIASGSSQKVTFTTTRTAAGTYEVDVNGLAGKFITGKPAAFVATDLLIAPAEVNTGEKVTITAQISNTGDFSGNYKATLKINDEQVESHEITLTGGESRKVPFTVARNSAGTYSVDINGLKGSFLVKTPPPAINWALIGGIILVLGAGLIAIWLFMRREKPRLNM